MNKLNLQQTARWTAAKRLFNTLILRAKLEGGTLLYTGMPIEDLSQIEITDDEIFVRIGNCKFTQFKADPNMAHGLELTIAEFESMVRADFTLIKKIDW